jgi:hypothetical protein
MLNGAPTVTVPEMAAVPVFCTVKLRSAVPLTGTLPKLVVVDGLTVRSAWATPLADPEHALSFPAASTAVIRATYVVPPERPVIWVETTWPVEGVAEVDETEWNDEPGQAGVAVPI